MLSVIFMQASAKMNAVLNCYEAEKRAGRSITIVLPHCLKDTKLFIDSLQLDAKTVVIRSLAGRNLYNWPLNIVRIKNAIKLMGVDKDTRFYFTDVNDVEIGLLLPYLKNNNPTQILTTIDINDGENYQINRITNNVITVIKAKLFSFLYKTTFIPLYDGSGYGIYTHDKALNFPKIDYSDNKVISKYLVKVTTVPNSVIFFSSPYVDTLYEREEFDRLNKDIIETLHRKGYYVMVKGHPRLGNPDIITQYADEIIPSYIPGEYLNLSSFVFAIGFFSTAVATSCEHIPSYSVCNVGKMKSEEHRKYYMKYLFDIAPDIKFIHSLEELPEFDNKH